MSVTVSPQVRMNASVATTACEAARKFSNEFNDEADKAGHAAAAGFADYSDEWYVAYDRAYKGFGDRATWIDAAMVMEGFAGWTMVGQGAFRTALLGPDGYIYKVGDLEDNKLEAIISESLHKVLDTCPKGFKVLDMKLVGEVLVTEFVPPQPDNSPYDDCFDHPEWNEFRRWAESHGCRIMDTHDGNVWWDGESMVIIDMGNWNYNGASKWGQR
jgi:hypothetical protein